MIDYKDCIVLGNSRDDLEFNMSQEEFNYAMSRRRKSPSQVKLRWCCTKNSQHVWEKAYSKIKIGSKCPLCRQISYNDCKKLGDSRDDLEFDMSRKEFNYAMSRRRKSPSHVKLRWRCTKNRQHTWKAHYRNISDGNGCPKCRQISYKDCVKLGNSRDDLELDMSRKEFNYAMEMRGSNNPNKVKLKWRCRENLDHRWNASYNSIQRNRGCPECAEMYAIKGTYLHKIIQYLITLFLFEINVKMFSEVELPSIINNNRYRVDALILNIKKSHYLYTKLRNAPKILSLFGLNVEDLNNINAFMFDFTSDLSYNNIKDKVRKYQRKDKILFIVGTQWRVKITDSSKNFRKTRYKNVLLIRYDLFARLIRLKGRYLEFFNNIISNLKSYSIPYLSWTSKLLRSKFYRKTGRDLYSTNDLALYLQNLNQ
ncbi:MAG: hypothetical protein GF353_24425 [Candidatus Lokiarchaeota archaeon]|nr:hypothetical protein [Candidatus Lokiarchaeota archaeon]